MDSFLHHIPFFIFDFEWLSGGDLSFPPPLVADVLHANLVADLEGLAQETTNILQAETHMLLLGQ